MKELSQNTLKYINEYTRANRYYDLNWKWCRTPNEYDIESLQKCIDADTTTRTFTRDVLDWYETVTIDYSNIDIAAARAELNELKYELLVKLQRRNERAAERLNLKRLDSLEHEMIERKEAAELISKYGCPVFQKNRIKVCKWTGPDHTRYWPKQSYYIKPFSVDGKYSKQDIIKSLKEIA